EGNAHGGRIENTPPALLAGIQLLIKPLQFPRTQQYVGFNKLEFFLPEFALMGFGRSQFYEIGDILNPMNNVGKPVVRQYDRGIDSTPVTLFQLPCLRIQYRMDLYSH